MINTPLSVSKIIVLGESGVGKTSLILQYTTHKFLEQYVATSVPDFFTADVKIEDKRKLVQVWDTSGKQGWHQNTGTKFYKGIDGCVLVFSLNDPLSFERLEFWRSFFISHSRVSNNERKNYPFVVIGNKSDSQNNKSINNELQISKKEAEEWGAAKNIPVFFTSAKSGKNLDLAINILLHKIEDKDFVYVNDRKAIKRSKKWQKYLTLLQVTSIALFSLYLYYSNGGLDDFITSFQANVNKYRL